MKWPRWRWSGWDSLSTSVLDKLETNGNLYLSVRLDQQPRLKAERVSRYH